MEDYKKYFEKKGKSCIFTGDKLEIFISSNWEKYKILSVTDVITTVGVFDLVINDKIKTGWFMPAVIRVEPSEITSVMIGDKKYYKATLKKGDIFIKSTNIIKNQQIAYLIFLEMIYLGNQPMWMTYEKTAYVFDLVSEICGMGFPVNPVVFEFIFSQLYRSSKDTNLLYRQTDMKSEEPVIVPLRALPHATKSTSSKIILATSYFNDSVDSALINQNDEPSDIEEIIRK